MFGKMKAKDKKPLVELLAFIVAGTMSTAAHALVPLTLVKQIQKAEPTFLQVLSETPDPAGNVPVKATAEGIAASGAPAPPASASTPSQFELEEGIAVPESKRGGLKGDTYPFAAMKVGQSFFVGATDAKPNPAKGLASTVSSANKRFASVYPATTGKDKTPHAKAGQPTGMDGRKFTVRNVDDPTKGKGARVFRIS